MYAINLVSWNYILGFIYQFIFQWKKKQEEKCIVLCAVEENNQSPINFVSYKWVNWLGMATHTFSLGTQETGARK